MKTEDIGIKPEPVDKIFDSLRDFCLNLMETNNKMLITISELEGYHELKKLNQKSFFTLINNISNIAHSCLQFSGGEIQGFNMAEFELRIKKALFQVNDQSLNKENDVQYTSGYNKAIEDAITGIKNVYGKPDPKYVTVISCLQSLKIKVQ